MAQPDDGQELARLRAEVSRLNRLTERQTRDLAALVILAEDRRFPGRAARRFWRALRRRLPDLWDRASRRAYAGAGGAGRKLAGRVRRLRR